MKSFVTVLVLGVLIVGGFYLYKNSSKTSGTDDMAQKGTDTSDLIVVDALASGTVILSPLAISGKARGKWYFEGSFPVSIVDDQGTLLGQGIATAQGEWMTENFVPFAGSITFTVPASDMTNGKVIFHKDNPSGLPENDDALIIPVQFAK